MALPQLLTLVYKLERLLLYFASNKNCFPVTYCKIVTLVLFYFSVTKVGMKMKKNHFRLDHLCNQEVARFK